jgi:tellurite resistance protein TerB
MAIWDQLKTRTETLNTQLKTKKDQFRNKDFANASMAMCALISAADGSIQASEIQASERQKTAALIASNDVLGVFRADELRQKYDSYCDKLNADFDFGKVEAVAAISTLRSKPDQARAVISIGLIIGSADGDFDADERRTVTEACHAVGIAPTEFDL